MTERESSSWVIRVEASPATSSVRPLQSASTARAKASQASIAQVILDPAFIEPLLATPRGPHIKRHINFMKGKPWVRHDEHYHVDFAVP